MPRCQPSGPAWATPGIAEMMQPAGITDELVGLNARANRGRAISRDQAPICVIADRTTLPFRHTTPFAHKTILSTDDAVQTVGNQR